MDLYDRLLDEAAEERRLGWTINTERPTLAGGIRHTPVKQVLKEQGWKPEVALLLYGLEGPSDSHLRTVVTAALTSA